MLVVLLQGCSFVKTDHYYTPLENSTKDGFLLRGGGLEDPKYGYSLDNVYQTKRDGVILAVQVKQFDWTLWMIGPIPTFGSVKESSSTKKENGSNGIKITIGIFAEKMEKLSIDFCKIESIFDNSIEVLPTKVGFSYLEQEKIFECNSLQDNIVFAKAHNKQDIATIDLFIKLQDTNPTSIKIKLPVIIYDGREIKIQNIEFISSSETGAGVAL